MSVSTASAERCFSTRVEETRDLVSEYNESNVADWSGLTLVRIHCDTPIDIARAVEASILSMGAVFS